MDKLYFSMVHIPIAMFDAILDCVVTADRTYKIEFVFHVPHLLNGSALIIPAWISNHMPSNLEGENTYPFPNFYGANVEV